MIMMLLTNVLLLLNIPLAISQSTRVSPCTVQNVILQPQYGISAKTKKLVDILQAPPNFTQTIHADICVNSDTTFSAHVRSNIPHFACRQRFSYVEVFLKSGEIPSMQSMLKFSGNQLPTEFIKDFVLIEAGCEAFFNFLPSRKVNRNKESTNKVEGIAALHGSESVHFDSQQLLSMFNVAESHSDYKNSHLKPRSMIQNDFFRNGMHLYSDTTENTTMTEQHLNSGNNIPTFGSEPEAESEIDNDNLREGEIRLSPDNIGLPLLILDPSIDPVMTIISHYSVK